MEIKTTVDFATGENCYILIDKGNCLVIDPGAAYAKVLEFIKERNLSLDKILLTHCHWDHTVGTEKLKKATGAKVLASAECKENLKNSKINVSELFGDKFELDLADEVLSEGDTIRLGDTEIKCIKTPGHTNCSVCYIAEDVVFSGDTLFAGTVGRWDFPTGNYEVLENSIRKKLYTLGDCTVLPGHGDSTTIERERRFNGCVRDER